MCRKEIVAGFACVAFGVLAPAAGAGTFESGSTGADGALNITANTTLTVPLSGVWHFTTININAVATLSFLKNAANTPITMLASGDVNIAGTIDLNGAKGGDHVKLTATYTNGGAGGPGASNGGSGGTQIPSSASTIGGTGLGPGGGKGGMTGVSVMCAGGGGGYGTPGASGVGGDYSSYCPPQSVGPGGVAYGTAVLAPLVGGSGGAGGAHVQGCTSAGGGGGGGALVLASSGTIFLTGIVKADGGKGGAGQPGTDNVFCNNFRAAPGGGGSGGAVRLVATNFAGTGGQITVKGEIGGPYNGTSEGGKGGSGRIRVEAHTSTAAWTYSVIPSFGIPGAATITGPPILIITSVGGVNAPASPTGSFSLPDLSLLPSAANPVAVNLSATNIPSGATITVRVTPQVGSPQTETTTLSGTTASVSFTNFPLEQPVVVDAEAAF